MIATIKKIDINEVTGLTTIVLNGENGIEYFEVLEKRRDKNLIEGQKVECGYYENLYTRMIDKITPVVD